MLRSQKICGLDGVIHIVCHQDISEVVQRLLYDLLPFQLGGKCIHPFGNILRQLLAAGHKDRRSKLIMLCLGQKVRSHILRIRCIVRQHQDLTGARDGINAYMSEYDTLSDGNKDISGAYDLIHLGDGLGSVCQRCNGLRTATFVDLRHTGFICCHQSGGIYNALCITGGCHDDIRNPCHSGRDHIHQYRGRISRLAARYINACILHRSDLLTQNGTVRLCCDPAVPLLKLMILFDIFDGLADHPKQIGIHCIIGICDLFLRHTHGLRRELCMIKACGILQQRLVPACMYLCHDLLNRCFVRTIIIRTPLDQILQQILLGFLCQFYDSHFVSFSSSSFSAAATSVRKARILVCSIFRLT